MSLAIADLQSRCLNMFCRRPCSAPSTSQPSTCDDSMQTSGSQDGLQTLSALYVSSARNFQTRLSCWRALRLWSRPQKLACLRMVRDGDIGCVEAFLSARFEISDACPIPRRQVEDKR